MYKVHQLLRTTQYSQNTVQRISACIIIDFGIGQSIIVDLDFLTDRPEQGQKSLAAIEVASLAVWVPDAVKEDYGSKLKRGISWSLGKKREYIHGCTTEGDPYMRPSSFRERVDMRQGPS